MVSVLDTVFLPLIKMGFEFLILSGLNCKVVPGGLVQFLILQMHLSWHWSIR